MEQETKPYRREDYTLGNGLYLSERQVEVLRQLGRGFSNKQIAHELGVAEPTVKMHVSSILRALNVQNRVQILLKAKELNFL
ncbi:MAG: response regulator transcription factor [Alphaproteobacteria bacterium]|nr:response regulator transcription factor [Alphaproteobacteria bacterium]MBQ3117021.1 response regulator transcription factor [Alphaproteobacteria bacterium]MBQ6854860.1 response regulator transcription factor [Alphaproteobacteria bacterium]MBQ8558338.1 response regulator transcription factor [Alphaproteobacteria bacterium]MBR3912874.1 response regulator transcription factor [Alphaproteobacteria bacterium]